MTAPNTTPAERTFTGQSPITVADYATARHTTKARKLRDVATAYDSFRREYTVVTDAVSRGMVEVFPTRPAPVHVPLHYMSIPERMPWRLEIDWSRYIADLKTADREWLLLVDRIMKDLYREGSDQYTEPTPRALKLAGTRPQDWRVVAFAAKGDPWALGFQEERTKRIRKILGDAPWLPAQTSSEADGDYGLEEDLADTLRDGDDPLVPIGFTDEIGAPARRAAAPKPRTVVGPPPLADDDDELSLDDAEGITEDDVRNALGDDDSEPLVDTTRATATAAKARPRG